MNPGDVVLAHNVNRIIGQDDNGKPTMTGQFVAPKGEDFVFVLLGTAPRKGIPPAGKPFNVDAAMHRLGWYRKVEAEKDAGRYRWLRDKNAYAPEEAAVSGGEDLDKLCDDGIAKASQ